MWRQWHTSETDTCCSLHIVSLTSSLPKLTFSSQWSSVQSHIWHIWEKRARSWRMGGKLQTTLHLTSQNNRWYTYSSPELLKNVPDLHAVFIWLLMQLSVLIGAVLVGLRVRLNVVCRWLRGRGRQQRSGRSMSVYKEKETRGGYSRGQTQRCTFALLITWSLTVKMATIVMHCFSM